MPRNARNLPFMYPGYKKSTSAVPLNLHFTLVDSSLDLFLSMRTIRHYEAKFLTKTDPLSKSIFKNYLNTGRLLGS